MNEIKAADARTDTPDRAAVEALLNAHFPNRTMDRVLLVNPPDADAGLFRFDTALRCRYTNYPPYGLMVLAANLEAIGVEVKISNLNHAVLTASHLAADEKSFDFDKVWRDQLKEDLGEFQPDLVGITCMFTMTHGSFKAVCEDVADHGYPVAIGGVHVSNDVDRVLDDVPSVSYAFLREGDRAIREFVNVVREQSTLEVLGQMVVSDGVSRYRFGRECQPGEAEIEMAPAYHLIDLPAHSKEGTIGAFYCFKPAGTTFATVLSNRGCRAQCTFCSVRNFNGTGVRQRSVGGVVDELEKLENEYGVGHVMWLDDDLFKDHGRAVSLFDEMVRRGLKLTWDATNGVIAASCTEEVISAAAESGCIAINIGMESGNREILKSVRKPGTVDTFLQAAEVLRRHEKIHSSVFLMVGFPNETMAMILDTIKVAREMDLDWYRISQLQPLPNTPIYDAMVAQGLIQTLGSKDLRFNGGAYGKQTEIEQGLQLATPDFIEAFSAIPLDSVPNADQLTDVWFFMNYHLNFHRIFHESRPEKVRQLDAHLRVLADVISPENGFSLYFLAYLEFASKGTIDPDLIDRLRSRLDSSSYWQDRLNAFGLSVEDLIERNFPSQAHVPFVSNAIEAGRR